MSGSAAVVGTLNAVASNKLPLHVIGLIPATDNRIGLNALVADDVITMHDGTTVEIQNTDAEGRLILADALSYAKKYKPELVIDLATLTGAASAITGPFGTAMVGSADQKTKAALGKCGDEVYERIAELPFWSEYGDLLKSEIADLKNIGGPTGGAITAGKFLAHFTDYPWIHLDIAGPAFITKPEPYKAIGGTGVGVRLLYRFLSNMANKQK
jgi:leucyl aminopeptidase